jgi:hypothetical protein
MDEQLENEVLPCVRADRRAFVKGIVAVAAFSAPMVASYDLESLSSSVALAASSNISNVVQPV